MSREDAIQLALMFVGNYDEASPDSVQYDYQEIGEDDVWVVIRNGEPYQEWICRGKFEGDRWSVLVRSFPSYHDTWVDVGEYGFILDVVRGR